MPTFSLLGQRTAQTGPLLPGALAAAHAVHSGKVPVLSTKETDMARSLFSSTAAPCLKCQPPAIRNMTRPPPRPISCWPRNASEARLGRALDFRSAGHQSGHSHAFRPVQESKRAWVFCRADAAVVPGIHRRPPQAADRLHFPTDAGGTTARDRRDGTLAGRSSACGSAEPGSKRKRRAMRPRRIAALQRTVRHSPVERCSFRTLAVCGRTLRPQLSRVSRFRRNDTTIQRPASRAASLLAKVRELYRLHLT